MRQQGRDLSTRGAFSVDICSACHPFYTGKQKFVDAAGRIERFQKKYGKGTPPEPTTTVSPLGVRGVGSIQLLLDKLAGRRGALPGAGRMLADPAVLANRQQMQKLSRSTPICASSSRRSASTAT